MADPLWERHLRPVLPDASTLLANLLEGDLLEILFSKELILGSCYDNLLQKLRTETSHRVAWDVLRILAKTPPPSFDQFCTIVAKIEGGNPLRQLLRGESGNKSFEKAKSVGLTTSHKPAKRQYGLLPDNPMYAQVLERLKALRLKLINSFDDQQILLLGVSGSGKSLLINSFNYVVNLAEDENTHFDEIAETSDSRGSSKTTHLFQYNAEIGGMYRSLLQSHNAEYKEKLQVAPTLYDAPGRLDTALLRDLLQGGITKSHTANTKSDTVKHLPAAKLPTAVILVCTMARNPEKASVQFPDRITDNISAAMSESDGKDRSSQTNVSDARVFVVLTHSDGVENSVRSQIRDIYVEQVESKLNVSGNRVFEVSNFTDDDRDPLFLAMRPNPKKQVQIIAAFLKILSAKR